jgi:hypothetical protein
VSNAKAYDAAFDKFFQRLAKDGITPANTAFVISAEENDQFAGANAGRATTPTPAGCDGVTVPCTYSAAQIGELQANLTGLLSTTPSSGTAFDIEPQGASIYIHGNPPAGDPAVRQLQRDTAAITGDDPYTGINGEQIVNYQAGGTEQRILHLQTSDPLRTPSYSLFPKPDYYLSTTGPTVSINNGFAYNHGYYSPNIDITWSALVGPGIAARGVDGPPPAAGNQPADPNSTRTVPQASTTGTWAEETDLRPTLLHTVGLTDDYQSDGRVISQILSQPSPALRATDDLAAAYQQLNSSVGQFATNTLIADSAALASGSATNDATFVREQRALRVLADARDQVAGKIKDELTQAAAGHPPRRAQQLRAQARALIAASEFLARTTAH